MPLNVLIILDKFKGTLSARQATEALTRGWHSTRPGDTLTALPMSDGGDGFGEIVKDLLAADERMTATQNAAHRSHQARWWMAKKSATGIVESAGVIGLALLPPGRYHPFELDTLGLGEVLKTVADSGARKCLMGIGGSATNDGGFGLARAIGWQFLDVQGKPILKWTHLGRLATIVVPKKPIHFQEFVVAVDVQNQLLGPEGCTRIYGPQKGLKLEELDQAEQCLGRLAEVVKSTLGQDFAVEPGAGAAGGLGFGLRAFAGARLQSGFELFAELAGLTHRIRQAQLVITGEGSLDPSTLMGKGVGEVARLCATLNVPCIGLGGMVSDDIATSGLFEVARGIVPDLTNELEAKQRAAYWLEQLAATVASRWTQPHVTTDH